MGGKEPTARLGICFPCPGTGVASKLCPTTVMPRLTIIYFSQEKAIHQRVSVPNSCEHELIECSADGPFLSALPEILRDIFTH